MFWPSSFRRAQAAERKLLNIGGILSADPNSADEKSSLSLVQISPGVYMNTLIIDNRDRKIDNPEDCRNIVMCHGFGAGLGFFYRNYRYISDNLPDSRIFAPDWLGMGLSSRPNFPKIKSVAEDNTAAVNFFLDSFELWRQQQPSLNSFVLVGHSLGGYLATLYAIRYPQRVKKLILLSPVGVPDCTDEKLTVTGSQYPDWVGSLWNRNYTPQWVVRIAGPFGPKLVKRYVEARFQYLQKEESEAMKEYFYQISAARGSGEYAMGTILAPGAWARVPLASKLKDLLMPTTFIYGEYDWMDHRQALKARNDAKVLLIPMAGHQLCLDNPLQFNEALVNEILSN